MNLSISHKPVVVIAAPVSHIRPRMLKKMGREMGMPLSAVELSILLEMHRNNQQKPPMLDLARQIMRGDFSKKEVDITEEDIRIKSARLAVSMREADLFPHQWLRAQSRLTMISDISRLGYRVALLALDPKDWLSLDPDFAGKAISAGVNKEDVVYITSNEDLAPRISFPRDFFVQLQDTIYLNPEFGHWNWENLFGWARGLERGYSRIGFGGEVVIGNGFAFLSKQYIPPEVQDAPYHLQAQMRLLEMTSVGETKNTLERKGFNVFEIPTAWIDLFPPQILSELGTRKKFLVPIDHADLQILYLAVEHAFFVGERYYRENREILDPIFDQIKPATFGILPDEDGLSINSFPLPNGGVYVDSAAKQSVKILREAGIKVHASSQPIGTWGWGMHGGIHCATNVLNLPFENGQT